MSRPIQREKTKQRRTSSSSPTAKHKLNAAVIAGIASVAGLIGLGTGSIGIFTIAFAVLAGCALLDKSLRL